MASQPSMQGEQAQAGLLFSNQSSIPTQFHSLPPPLDGTSQKRAGPDCRLQQILHRHQPRRGQVVVPRRESPLEILRQGDPDQQTRDGQERKAKCF